MRSKLFVQALLALSLSCTPLNAQTQNEIPSLDKIYEPVIVGVVPCDAYVGLSKMDDGEWRHYNYGENAASQRPLYLSSKNQGKSWQTKFLPKDIPYADQKSPISGEYIRIFTGNGKVYALRTEGGLEGGRTIIKIDDKLGIMNKPPIFVRGGKRIISAAHRTDRSGAYVYYSDDDGRSWKISQQVNAPKHVKSGFHQGIRWNHGAVEPTVVELNDGRLWMIMRTAQDKHYQSFSTDGGETWSMATPSPFYGTITMPTLYRMHDGRLLFFWCNTTPLPELPTATGVWDDVFTNRDAVHVAISEDDGKTWMGFRELMLNAERNSDNFGNTVSGQDKSVHQVQAVEVEPGKILVAAGQHAQCRRLLVFDVSWLYEPVRTNDFSDGLSQWSAFRYYKGIVGHCCYNRQEEPILVNHPDCKDAKAMQLKYEPNDKFLQDNQGAVWNFPTAKNGFVKLSMKFPKGSESVDLILNDRWFNPTDTVARYECMYTLPLNRKKLNIHDEKWHTVSIYWQHNKRAVVRVDGRKRANLPSVNATEHGISYLHLLGGQRLDTTGIFIEYVEGGKELIK